jgi:hypothetical protein
MKDFDDIKVNGTTTKIKQWCMVTDDPALGFQYWVVMSHVPDISQECAASQENSNTNSLIIIWTLKIEAAHFYKMLSTQPTATW